jgi:ankyrin repeat protein
VAAWLALCLNATAEANRTLAYALYVAWALDNEGGSEPRTEDERLAEAVWRYPYIDDVMGYISEHERLAPLASVLAQAGTDADLEDPHDGSTALSDAVLAGRVEAAERLIGAGADVDHTDVTGETLLMAAVMNRDLPMARLVIAHGADVNARTRLGTPLILAAATRSAAMANLLLEAGAAVDGTTEDGETPLARAASDPQGSLELIRVLLDAGADPYREYPPGRSLIREARESRLTGVLELLLEAVEGKDSAR